MIRDQICILSRTFFKLPFPFFSSHLHTQEVFQKQYNIIQRAKLAQKLLAKNENMFKKKKNVCAQNNPHTLVASIYNQKYDSHNITIRMNRLNKIFMEHISETLMSSHHYLELSKIGFQITQIRVQPKMTAIHIYYYCSIIVDDEEFMKLLISLSKYLHYELSSQRIIGRIPPVVFVRDDILQNSLEVDKRLKVADFGPDYVPIHSTETSQAFPSVKRQISEETWKVIDGLSENIKSTKESKRDFPHDVLFIRQNVFGVDREKIMKNITTKCKESKGLHRLVEEEPKSSFTSSGGQIERPHSHNPSAHSRTHEIKKWAAQFKKVRKNTVTKKQKQLEEKEMMTAGIEEVELEMDYESDEDFDQESYYDEILDPDSRS